jgi:hypothetical protein
MLVHERQWKADDGHSMIVKAHPEQAQACMKKVNFFLIPTV